MEMPVYLFTGYLEAGKTKFIQETLEDPRFNSGERILVLLCEEGEEELDPSTYPGNGENITVHSIEERSKITPDRLAALGKRSGAERVMVEYNGMWELDTLYNNLPDGWFVCQEVMIADATTYLAYNTNMRQQTVDKLQSAEVVIFNRVTPETERLPLHKIVRGISRRAQILYETIDGELEQDTIEDPLPFDINAPIIEIKDQDYAIWYRDLIEETQKYEGKTVRFRGIIAKDDRLPGDVLAIGRHVMTCCVDDIAYRALALHTSEASRYQMRDWVAVTARISMAYSKLYQTKGPVLKPISIERSTPADPEVATFY
jgi:hypothetical protein